MLRTMMILKMQKYSKYIKISHIQEMSYILVALVILSANVCQISEVKQNHESIVRMINFT